MSCEVDQERCLRARAACLGDDGDRDGAGAVSDGDGGSRSHVVRLPGVNELCGVGTVCLEFIDNSGCVFDGGRGAFPISPSVGWVVARAGARDFRGRGRGASGARPVCPSLGWVIAGACAGDLDGSRAAGRGPIFP